MISDEDISQKRHVSTLEEEPVYKKLRRASPVYPMEWEATPPPVKRGKFRLCDGGIMDCLFEKL